MIYDHIANQENVVRHGEVWGKAGRIPGNQTILHIPVSERTGIPQNRTGECDGAASADGSKEAIHGPVPEWIL